MQKTTVCVRSSDNEITLPYIVLSLTKNPTSAMEKFDQKWENCFESCCGADIKSSEDGMSRGSLDSSLARLWLTFSIAVG